MSDRQFHIPSLDGVRGFAALMVFVSHCGLQHLIPGGFGVTIFFFLSGYLITTLLRLEFASTGDISLRKFYLRRVYRIFPPLYIVLTLLTALAIFGISRNQITLGAVVAQYAQLTNYYMVYADGRHLVPYTGPMWSLGVEEHFYLLFPLLLLFMMRSGRSARQIATILGAICVAVLLWRCYLIFLAGSGQNHTYKATDTRIDSMLFGCILGVWCNPALDSEKVRPGRNTWIVLLLASVGLLTVTFLYRNPEFRETLRYSLQGIGLFSIFFCAVRYPHWPVFSWLNSRVMRWAGLLSYTFYLCHLSFLRLANKYLGVDGLAEAAIGFVASVAFSWAMYVLVERHMGALRKKLHSSARPATTGRALKAQARGST